jgi:hypothetical protein
LSAVSCISHLLLVIEYDVLGVGIVSGHSARLVRKAQRWIERSDDQKKKKKKKKKKQIGFAVDVDHGVLFGNSNPILHESVIMLPFTLS